MSIAARVLDYLQGQDQALAGLLEELIALNSHAADAAGQDAMLKHLAMALSGLGFGVRRLPGRFSAGQLVAYPRSRKRGRPLQLLLGHVDTLRSSRAPEQRQQGRLYGPGAGDMKGGLAQLVFALKTLQALDLTPPLTPVVFINSDATVGSRESAPAICRLARIAHRAYVLKPPLGAEGRLKTSRKGSGRYTLTVRSLPGADPGAAVAELSRAVQAVFALNAPAQGVSVDVVSLDTGLKPGVAAPAARASVDVLAPDAAAAHRIETALKSLIAQAAGLELVVTGAMVRPPLERTPATAALWEQARKQGTALGLTLQEAAGAVATDANLAGQHTATLDGLGAVNDDFHAQVESVAVARLVERSALLTLLLLAPDLGPIRGPARD